jgi:hypothetical protein
VKACKGQENMSSNEIMFVLESIREDCEKDAANLDGMPLNGKTVGTMFGNVLAAISALAGIMIQKQNGEAPRNDAGTSTEPEEAVSRAVTEPV